MVNGDNGDERGPRGREGERGPRGIAGGEQAYKWIISIGSALIGLLMWQLYQTINRTDARVDEIAAIVARNTGKLESLDHQHTEIKASIDSVDNKRRDDNLRQQDHFENIENRMFDLMKLHVAPYDSSTPPIQRKPPR